MNNALESKPLSSSYEHDLEYWINSCADMYIHVHVTWHVTPLIQPHTGVHAWTVGPQCSNEPPPQTHTTQLPPCTTDTLTHLPVNIKTVDIIMGHTIISSKQDCPAAHQGEGEPLQWWGRMSGDGRCAPLS